jgi:hypothetical protein
MPFANSTDAVRASGHSFPGLSRGTACPRRYRHRQTGVSARTFCGEHRSAGSCWAPESGAPVTYS